MLWDNPEFSHARDDSPVGSGVVHFIVGLTPACNVEKQQMHANDTSTQFSVPY
jgi:hypothetical protein